MSETDLVTRCRLGDSEAISEAIRLHSGMVYGVCLRMLGDAHDAEDAAQAAFLVLLRKARGLAANTDLAGWLFWTAKTTAMNAATMRRRRRSHERKAAGEKPMKADASEEAIWEEVRPGLDAAMASLPAKERQATILRYYYGKTEKEIASEVGCGRSTVAERLARGLERLRMKLAGAGAPVPAALLASLLTDRAVETVPGTLVASIQALCAGQAVASPAAAAISKGAIKMMLWAKVKLISAAVCAAVAVGGGGVLAVKRMVAAEPAAAPARGVATPEAGGDAEVVSQVHNAPEWKAGTAYLKGNRVVNLETKPARAYECVTGGTSGAPAPDGAGSAVKDGGGVVWRYLSDVDYTTISAWLYDAPAWKKGATYIFRDYVTAGKPLSSYRCAQPGAGPSTVMPSGEGTGKTAGADGYRWEKMAAIGYSSGRSFIPKQKYFDGPGKRATVQMKRIHTAQLWNDAEYVAGERGERHPIDIQDHQSFYPGDTSPNGRSGKIYVKLTAAPGESFMDRPKAPLRYDQTYGVAIRNPSGGVAGWGRSPGNAILTHDSSVTLDRLQLRSQTGRAVGDVANHNNGINLTNCILQSDATGNIAAVEIDCGCTVRNCLVIGSGKVGLWSKYPMLVESCTVVSVKPAPDSIGVLPVTAWNKFCDGMTVMKNCAVFGWANAVGHGPRKYSPDWWHHAKSSNNATDTAANSDHRIVEFNRSKITVDPLPGKGNHFKVAGDKKLFVDPGQDWRISPDSELRGLGLQR